MFRVPVDIDGPTFGRTEKVSLRRWLTSSRADRVEWSRRRNLAAETAAANKVQRAGGAAARREAARRGEAESVDRAEREAILKP